MSREDFTILAEPKPPNSTNGTSSSKGKKQTRSRNRFDLTAALLVVLIVALYFLVDHYWPYISTLTFADIFLFSLDVLRFLLPIALAIAALELILYIAEWIIRKTVRGVAKSVSYKGDEAKVVAKEKRVMFCFVTFDYNDGERIRIKIPKSDATDIVVGDIGTLVLTGGIFVDHIRGLAANK